MRFIRLILVMTFISSAMPGCKTIDSIFNNDAYDPPPIRHLPTLENSKWIPHASELDGQAMKIIWNVSTDLRQDTLALKSKIEESIQHNLRAEGIQIKNPEDQQTVKLIEEIERARKNSTELNQGGEQKVRFYVKGSLTKSSLENKFTKPIWIPFSKKKRPGSCKYDLKSGFQVEVLSLPSLMRVKHFGMDVEDSFSIDMYDTCVPYHSIPEAQNEYQITHAKVLKKIVSCNAKSLKKYLAPQAYIEEYYSDGENHIYLISSGSAAGFKKGNKLNLLRKNSSGLLVLGKAKVIAVQPYKAYIKVKDEKLRDKIRLHDQVKVQYIDFTFGCRGNRTEH